jgi:hypothetical protein
LVAGSQDGLCRELVVHLPGVSWAARTGQGEAARSPTGEYSAAAVGTGIFVWDSRSLSLVAAQDWAAEAARPIVFSPSGTFLAAGSLDGRCKIWEFSEVRCEAVASFEAQTGE